MILEDFSKRCKPNGTIWVTADRHVGDQATHWKLIKKEVSLMSENPDDRVVVLGDMCGCIHHLDPRFDADMHAGAYQTANAQAKAVAELYAPVAEQVLVWLDGNHEAKFVKDHDYSEMVLEQWKHVHKKKVDHIRYGSVEAAIRVTKNCKLYLTHGYGSVNSRAQSRRRREENDADSVRRKLVDAAGDCHGMFMGHIHKMRIYPPDDNLYLTSTPNKLKQFYPSVRDVKAPFVPEQFRWYASTGSALRTRLVTPKKLDSGERWDTYSSKRMYAGVELGLLKLTLKNGWLINVEKVKL